MQQASGEIKTVMQRFETVSFEERNALALSLSWRSFLSNH